VKTFFETQIYIQEHCGAVAASLMIYFKQFKTKICANVIGYIPTNFVRSSTKLFLSPTAMAYALYIFNLTSQSSDV